MKTTLLSLIFIFSTFVVFAVEWKVPEDYPTIQEAIDNATPGDVIIIANGTYYENISFNGKSIVVTSLFHISNQEADIINTIIDGSQPDDPDVGSVVSFNNNETIGATLKGFTIRGGTGTRTYNAQENLYFRTGGGILIDYASPTITNNIIENNHCVADASVYGAGGGGIRMGFGLPTIKNNIIRNNSGGYAGGMMIAYCGGVVIKNNVIANNSASGAFDGGGGVYVDWEPITLENNTIVNNHSDGRGGGIISTGTITNVSNCIVYGNTAGLSDPQIYKRIQGNARLTYTCIEGSFNGTGSEVGMITTDPMFDNTTHYYLSTSSPCIDTGNPNAIYNDIENQNNPGNAHFPSLGTITNDMGAYGGQGTNLLSDLNNVRPLEGITFSFANPYTNQGITAVSELNTFLSFRVFSIDGRLVHQPAVFQLTPGENFIPLQIDHSSIILFYNDTGVQSFKMIK